MYPIVFINCSVFPFVLWILSGLKLFETRNRDTLKKLVGRRVMLAETGKGKKPIVKCIATIDYVIRIDNYKQWKKYRKQCRIVPGSAFDWAKGKTKYKYLYHLTDIEKIPEFNPPEGFRHGRVWMEYYLDPEPEYIQYIADCYHCSDCWGEKMTVDDMRISLIEWNKEKDPGDYCPDPSLARECADYWNHLCDMFPG